MIATLFFGLGNMLNAQVTTGTIHGKIVDAITQAPLPSAKVWVDTEGGPRRVLTDTSGRYKIDGLKPGTYALYAKFTGYDTSKVVGITVSPDGLTQVDVPLTGDNLLGDVVITVYKNPLIDTDLPRFKIATEDLEHNINIRDPKMMLTASSSDIKMQEGTDQLIIRGSRPGDAVYYIDGVKMTDMSSVPGVAIGGMEAYTGGIPAKYGDTTGGVVILETKSYFDLYNAWLAGQ